MPLFGAVHVSLLAGIAALAVCLSILCRKRRISLRAVRLTLAWGLTINELIWFRFLYGHEGLRFPVNLPLQLCDLSLWTTIFACFTLAPWIVEFAYFAGLAGAGMALLTPDLWSPWPTYPAVYFFIAHGEIVIAVSVLVFGNIVPMRPNAVWRAYGLLVAYASAVGLFNRTYGTNYMYLCKKPVNASLLDSFGPWPTYLIASAVAALALFWLLWLPVRPRPTTA